MAQFVPSSSTTPVVTSQLLNPPASLRSPTTVSSSSSTPIVVPSSSAAPGSCCEGGRPIVADPLTGQLVCSCQLENPSAASTLFCGLNRAAAAAAGLASVGSVGVAGLGPAMGFYGAYAAAATAAPNSDAAFLPAALTGEQAYYGAQGIDLKEMTPSWPYPASMYYPYDGALAAAAAAGYPFNGYGMDINGARRKNATRETTATLKAWLSEHKKNPYPTKGEKIMLAIITKMTLTQVSTWFANARRRLKKENKMTWEPKNRQEEDDTGDDDDLISNKDMAVGAEERSERLLHGDASRLDRKSPAPGDGEGDDDEELELLDSDSCPSPPPTNLAASSGARSEVKPLYRGPEPDGWPRPRLQAPTSPSSSLRTDSVTSSNDGHGGVTEIPLVKPRIWSLADMASGSRSQHNNNNNDPATALSTDNFLFHHPHHHQQQSNGGLLHNTRSFLMANGLPVTAAEGAAAAAAAAAATAAAPGKMYNPLPRLPIDTAPYPRPYFRFSGLDSRLLGNYRFPAHDLYPHFNASIVNTNSSQSMADSLALLAAKVSTAARPSWGSTTGPLVVASEGKERLESDMKPGG